MSDVSRLLRAIREDPFRKLTLSGSQTVYGFGSHDSFQDLAERYCNRTGIYQTVDEIPWFDILMRRSRFSNIPAKDFASTSSGLWNADFYAGWDFSFVMKLTFVGSMMWCFESMVRVFSLYTLAK